MSVSFLLLASGTAAAGYLSVVIPWWTAVQDPTSHNLLPFEFVVYAVLAVPGMFGGLVGRLITRAGRWMLRRLGNAGP